jgi:3-hydroxy-9,10-secoandrosta-1,3,5(10)-triene-9,17-dione monooxygenase
MRSSGSNSVRVKEVFVPDHMVVAAEPPLLWGGHQDGHPTPGTILHRNPMYLGRVSGPYHASLVSPIVGAARAALDEYEEIVTTKMTMFPPIQPRFHHYDVQSSFGQALSMTDAAETLLFAAVDKYMELCRRWAKDGTPLSLEESLRLWGMIQNAGRLASEAVELLFQTASSSAARKGHRLQRYFRDVAMYRGHISSQFLNMASTIARVHFGLPGTGQFGL